MPPKKNVKKSRWQPLPENATTCQVMIVPGVDDHPVKLEELSKEDLTNCAKFIEQSNKTLEVENTVIERYLLRMDPTILTKVDHGQDAGAANLVRGEKSQLGPVMSAFSIPMSKADTEPEPQLSLRSTLTKSFSQTFGNRLPLLLLADKGPKVQPMHKIEIVNRETEELRNYLEEFRAHTRHSNYILRCRNEELSIRLREIVDSRDYFENKLLVEGLDPLTGKLPGEKFIRYIEVKLHSEESEIDKIRMKTSSVRNQLKRVQQQLAQKAELGEILHAIDFEQIKIENKDCQEKLEEKNLHLIEVKKINGRFGTILNFNLKKLQEQINRLGDLQKNIEIKEKMIEQLKLDEVKVNKEVEAASKSVKKITNLMNNFTVPDVFDYILKKAEVQEIKKDIKTYERKLKLTDLALASQAKKLRDKLEVDIGLSRSKSLSKSKSRKL